MTSRGAVKKNYARRNRAFAGLGHAGALMPDAGEFRIASAIGILLEPGERGRKP